MDWQPIETMAECLDASGNPVLIFNPSLRDDSDFPGHAIQVSNPVFASNGNAAKQGYTHWMPIPKPPQ